MNTLGKLERLQIKRGSPYIVRCLIGVGHARSREDQLVGSRRSGRQQRVAIDVHAYVVIGRVGGETVVN